MTLDEFAKKFGFVHDENYGRYYPQGGGRVYSNEQLKDLHQNYRENGGCEKCHWPEVEQGQDQWNPLTGQWEKVGDEKYCSSCAFWAYYFGIRDHPKVVRIEHHHYFIQDEAGKNERFKGFGGRGFKIKFTNGRVVETNNLWLQGSIPPVWRDDLPDNAQFETIG